MSVILQCAQYNTKQGKNQELPQASILLIQENESTLKITDESDCSHWNAVNEETDYAVSAVAAAYSKMKRIIVITICHSSYCLKTFSLHNKPPTSSSRAYECQKVF